MAYSPFRINNAGMIAAGATLYWVIFGNDVDRGAVFAQALPLERLSELDTDRQAIFKQLDDLTYSIRIINVAGSPATRFSIVGAVLS